MTTLQRYKPIPPVKDLRPGYKAGWKFDVLVLPAEAQDKIGSITLAHSTRADEEGAAIIARIVDISPTAFKTQDWEATGLPCPYKVGDIVVTKRYPASTLLLGADDRWYKMLKDDEIIGLKEEAAWS